MQISFLNKIKTPRLSRRFLTICLVTLFACIHFQNAYAHGGVSMDIDSCKFKLANHHLHYAGYKSTETGPIEYCWDIPSSGVAYLTFDFINDELRSKETSFQLFRKTSPDTQEKENPIASIPFAKHNTGSMNIDVELDKGHYLGIVSIKEDGSVHHAKLNINVGFENDKIPAPLLGLLLFSVALMFFYFIKQRKKTKTA